MGKTAFIFPGQGSQYVGMGKDFYEQIPLSAEIFDLAQEASGLGPRRARGGARAGETGEDEEEQVIGERADEARSTAAWN